MISDIHSLRDDAGKRHGPDQRLRTAGAHTDHSLTNILTP